MASRDASPDPTSTPTSPQLTPKSKVKAMLAALDSGSENGDNETSSISARQKLVESLAAHQPLIIPRGAANKLNRAVNDFENVHSAEQMSETDAEEDEDIGCPRGRLARAMLGSEMLTADDARDAPECIDNPLMPSGKLYNTSKDGGECGSDVEDEDEDELPVQRRRTMVRSHRNTPAVSHNSALLLRSPSRSSTKAVSPSPASDASDSDGLPATPLTSGDRFQALVAKKRQERLAKEAEVAQKKEKAYLEMKRQAALLEDDEGEVSDEIVERRLTQQGKPTRKASKKAIDEIHKETQRLSRNQQLTHKAITKKKITKSSLFAKFNYRPAGFVDGCDEQPQPPSSSPTTHSYSESKETPPTSPPSTKGHLSGMENDCEELPILEHALADTEPFPLRKLNKGKGKAIAEYNQKPEGHQQKAAFVKKATRIRPAQIPAKTIILSDSDSDLEILKSTSIKKKVDAMFDNVPTKQAKEPHSVHTLRMLAHLKSPGKESSGKAPKGCMTSTQLQMSLQQRARQQAAREREERLQTLRDKGVIVQTAAEREKEMAEVEDLLAKARQEGEELSKREKAAAKMRKERDGSKALDDGGSDADWEEEKENLAKQLSGSEDDDDFDGEANDASGEEEEEETDGENLATDNDDETEGPAGNLAIDAEAAESENDETEAENEEGLSLREYASEEREVDDEDHQTRPNRNLRRKKANVISDDEDDEQYQPRNTPLPPKFVSPLKTQTGSPLVPNSVLRSATKTFIPGLTVIGPAGLGLTQIFAGTMDSQDGTSQNSPLLPSRYSQPIDTEQDSLAFLRRLPAPEMPSFAPTMQEGTQGVVRNSQGDLETQLMDSATQGIQLEYSQSQIHGFDSLLHESLPSQFQESTQDMGYQHMTPIRGRFTEPPPSTVETVLLEPAFTPSKVEETPVFRKKGKLRQRTHVTSFSDDEDMGNSAVVEAQEDEGDTAPNVFDILRQGTKKQKAAVDAFNKKNSKAKEMVNEQAEESEDEYAGLGGASDDESGGEADEYIKEMIDDEGGQNVDEHKLAAFFADRERANDEKQVEKLYKDITKGMLRRKRGADYDLSDSDEGGEARRQRKRKDFAKMRKALLADERLGKIAENPKRQAFIRAIEDRGSEDDIDFLDSVEQEQGPDSQSQSQMEASQQRVPDSQPPVVMGPPKRKMSDDATDLGNRPPPHLRRTQSSKRPSSLAEIRQSVSSLIEDPDSVTSPLEAASGSDDDLEVEDELGLDPSQRPEKENRDPFARRNTSVAVVDRISLKRASTTDVSTSTRLAFASASATSGFKVPPLLRRVATNSSITSSTSSSASSVSSGMSATERMAGGSSGSDGIKRGGGKNSGVHYFAREAERRNALLKTEKMREQRRFKGVETRRKAVGGLFGGGKFE